MLSSVTSRHLMYYELDYYVVVIIIHHGKTPLVQKLQKEANQFVWQSTVLWPVVINKPSCCKTELNRYTITEIRWNKNEDARTSLVVSTNRQLNSLKNWKASLLIGPWDSTAIGTNSPCDESPAYLTTLLDAANSAPAPASRSYRFCCPR